MDDRIKELDDYIQLLKEDTDLKLKGEHLSAIQYMVDELICENNYEQEGYFISINDIGPEDDFTRFYIVLGKMNRAKAIRINKENSDDSIYGAGYNDGVREVTKEEYDCWHALACYSEMLEFSRWMDTSMRLSDIELDPIKKKISELRHRLGLNRHWQIVRLYRK